MNKCCRYIFLWSCLLFSAVTRSQQPDPLRNPCDTVVPERYGFLHLSENFISDPQNTLFPLFRELYGLRRLQLPLPDTVAPPVVSILHIGDSHIQAGFLTGKVRQYLQQEFGNAGRGLAVPYKLARTNEPRDYRILSGAPWENEKCIRTRTEEPPGIGGLSLATTAPAFAFQIRTYATDSCTDPRFNRIRVFRHELAPELLEDELYNTDTHCCENDSDPSYISDIPLNRLTDSIVLTGVTGVPYDKPVYYGFSLENGNPGILYHAAGINGACFSHFAQHENFIRQTAALSPGLIVLSLGTNEAAVNRFEPATFYYNIDRLVSALRSTNPGAAVLLVTPVENYRRINRRRQRTYIPNDHIAEAAAVIRRYAADHGLAWWDLYEVAGGRGSHAEWFRHRLFQRDRIHFTPEGYELQAKLLYQALIRNYNSYLCNHVR